MTRPTALRKLLAALRSVLRPAPRSVDRRRGARLLGCLTLALALAQAVPAQEGEEPAKPAPPKVLRTPQDDRRAGRAAAEQVGAEMGIAGGEELLRYVNAVGQRLARNAPGYAFDYSFAVVDQDVPNAFALPGGYIFISRGLLLLTNSEDELANVIGHEITHVAMRHAAARQAVDSKAAMFSMTGMGRIAAYGRDQERTSDRLGQGLAGLAGYDPAGMADFLKGLEYLDRLRLGSSRLPGFFDTHPATRERVAEAAQRASKIRWTRKPGIAKSRAEYLARLEGLPVGSSASEGVFRGSRFLHPDLAFTLRFPDGWETVNTHRAVGAGSPRRDAQVFLEGQQQGSDAKAAAEGFLEQAYEQGFTGRTAQAVRIAGAQGWRVTGSAGGRGGNLGVMFTWVPYDGTIYRITGIARASAFQRYEAQFMNTARSFRPLTAEMISGIRETRLRVVKARGGESLKALSERTGNQWPLQNLAVMNDVFADRPLEAGRLMKVAVAEPYRPRSGARSARVAPEPASSAAGGAR